MPRKKHRYIVHINGGCKKNELIYHYGRVRNISLRIGKQRATIAFETGTAMAATELTSFKSKLFRDAYRKVLFLHALMKDEGLVVNRMEIIIDGEESIFDKSTPFFPFLFSMIEKKPLNLLDNWSNIVPAILSTPKSEMEKDLRFVSVFSFLASKSKQYVIERFTNLWTAMNAYYSYIALCYENELRYELGMTDKREPIKKSLRLYKIDGLSVGALCWLLFPQYKKLTREESDRLWFKNYRTEKILSEYSLAQIKNLYEASYAELKGTLLPPQYKDLSECAELFGVPLFTYLLLIYAYHWRCNLFHGNQVTMLFCAYNDYEIAVLHTVNYFLDRFLNEEIPKMFQSDFFGDDFDRVKQYMRVISVKPNGQNDFDKAFEKEKNKNIGKP